MNPRWKRVPIKSVYHGLYDGPHATPKPSDEGPIFLGIKNLTDDGHFDFSEIRHIAEEDYPRWTRRIEPRENDIVFTYEATLNRYALIPPGFRGCLGRRLAMIRPDTSKVDPGFLFLYMFSDDWRGTIASKVIQGATVDRIPLIHFPDFPISLPDLPTQRKIAGILSSYDDLIRNNTRRIAVLEEMAQALYSEWFVKSPLKRRRYVTGDLMKSGFLEIGDGYRAKNSELATEGLPFARAGNINNGFHFDDADLLCHDSVRRAKEKVSQAGDIVFTSKGTVGRFAFVTKNTRQFVYAPQLCYWRSLNAAELQPLFLLHWMQTDNFLDQVGKVKGLTDMADYVSLSDQRKMVIDLPTTAEQRWVVDHLEPIQLLIENNRRRIDTLRATRDLLLPKLITGQLDVEQLDIDAGADLVEASA